MKDYLYHQKNIQEEKHQNLIYKINLFLKFIIESFIQGKFHVDIVPKSLKNLGRSVAEIIARDSILVLNTGWGCCISVCGKTQHR